MDRRGFIGGSDLYSIMRGDWYDLWLIKTGQKEPDNLDHIFRVQLGVATEALNISWLAQQINGEATDSQSRYEAVVKGVPYKGTIDGLIDNGEALCLVEAKHTGSSRSMQDMIDSYMPQIQLYMYLSGTRQAYLTVIFGNEHDYTLIDYDDAYCDAVTSVVAEFWQHVTDNTAPDRDTPATKIDWSHIKIDGLKMRDANNDNAFVSLAYDFVKTQDTAKQHEAVKKELRSMIADDEREVFCDLLTIKRDKRGACRITVNEGVVLQ